MTDYDHWPPIKFRFFGDEDQAKGRIPQARTLMSQLIRRMEGQERDNGQWQVQAEDGTRFRVTKMGDVHVADIFGVSPRVENQGPPMRDITPDAHEFALREILMRPHGERFGDGKLDLFIAMGRASIVGYAGMTDEGDPPFFSVHLTVTETRFLDEYPGLEPFHSIAQLDSPILWSNGIGVTYGDVEPPNIGTYGEFTYPFDMWSEGGYITMSSNEDYQKLTSKSEFQPGAEVWNQYAVDGIYTDLQPGVKVTALLFADWLFAQNLHPYGAIDFPVEVISSKGNSVSRETKTFTIATPMYESTGSATPFEDLLGWTSVGAITVTVKDDGNIATDFIPIDPLGRATVA